ncbi:MAG: TIGR00282 family metallophosphoesterase [Proteobacteria bacterium]|nr:TIGR00282 family metallophosphoesterase [Pseudomonadota bacterium]MDA1058968.1 TIGR00282 family metallophosphoesterase [Pseudomonadota bacterium]
MKCLFLGDVVGRAGRDAVIEKVPSLRERLGLDMVVVNGENAAGGFGITEEICQAFYGAGVDIVTGGNHSWDQQQVIGYIDGDTRLMRPLNIAPDAPGRGAQIYNLAGRKVMVINLQGQVFMEPNDSPFRAVEKALANVRLGATVNFILVDFHAEATSEKMAMGHFLDGRVSAVFGSHQQVPTADSMILNGGTAYQTDAGMCGDYDSVIGMDKGVPLDRFAGRVIRARMTPALGEATLCGVFVETDDTTGLATTVAPVRQGGRLAPAWPVS